MSKKLNTKLLSHILENIKSNVGNNNDFVTIIKYFCEIEKAYNSNFHKAADYAFNLTKKLLYVYFGKESQCIQLLKNWNEVETLFYASDEYYRDHILHAFNTFLLGLSIGTDLELFTSDRDEDNRNYNWYKSSTSNRLRAWQFASFFHDIGYPVEKAKNIGDFLRDKYFKFIPQFSVNDLEVIIPQRYPSQKNEDCISEITKGFLRDNKWRHARGHYNIDSMFQESLLGKNHGIVSAYMLWQVAFSDRILSGKGYDKELKNILRFACTAIALHTMFTRDEFSFLHINRKDLPLAFLLILCDELQEWDRPYRQEKFPKLRSKHYEPKIKFQNIKAIEDNDKIIIEIHCKEEEDRIKTLNKKYTKIFSLPSIVCNNVRVRIKQA